MSAYTSGTYPALTTPPAGQTDDPYIGVIGGKHYLMMVKTQVKGLFWYNKKVFTGTAPTTFDQMLAINPSQYGAHKLFCAAFESGTASGGPASDQIDNIIMPENEATVYTNCIQPNSNFPDPQVNV